MEDKYSDQQYRIRLAILKFRQIMSRAWASQRWSCMSSSRSWEPGLENLQETSYEGQDEAPPPVQTSVWSKPSLVQDSIPAVHIQETQEQAGNLTSSWSKAIRQKMSDDYLLDKSWLKVTLKYFEQDKVDVASLSYQYYEGRTVSCSTWEWPQDQEYYTPQGGDIGVYDSDE